MLYTASLENNSKGSAAGDMEFRFWGGGKGDWKLVRHVRLKQAAGFLLPFKSRVHWLSRRLTDPGEDFLSATTLPSYPQVLPRTIFVDFSSSYSESVSSIRPAQAGLLVRSCDQWITCFILPCYGHTTMNVTALLLAGWYGGYSKDR